MTASTSVSLSAGQQEKLLRHIRRISTMELVGLILARKGIARTAANWDEMLGRLRSSLESPATFSADELVGHALEIEEHGRQHIFLYNVEQEGVPKQEGQPSLNWPLLEKAALQFKTQGDLERTGELLEPESPTLVKAEVNEDGFTFKQVFMREEWHRTSDREQGDTRTMTWERTRRRSASLLRVRRDGVAEVRIEKRTPRFEASSHSLYERERNLLTMQVSEKLGCEFIPLKLGRLRANLWRDRSTLPDGFRICNMKGRTFDGIELALAASALDATLVNEEVVAETVKAFDHHDGRLRRFVLSCDFHPYTDSDRRRTVNITIPDRGNRGTNVIIVQARCEKVEYEYILKGILQFAR
ncbi:MAG: hypothetical protein K0U98_11485 [Deltaproteobacteria bacterium]|nr:hypothetical protein [Deltaproteobacteria bacterium]